MCVCFCMFSSEYVLSIIDELLIVKEEEEKLSQCYSRNNTSLEQQKQDGGRCADSCFPSVLLGCDRREQPVQVREPAGPVPNAGRTFSLAAFVTHKCAEDVGFAGWPHGSTPLTSPFCPGLHISDLSASSCQVLWRLSLFFFNVNFLPLSSLLAYFYFFCHWLCSTSPLFLIFSPSLCLSLPDFKFTHPECLQSYFFYFFIPALEQSAPVSILPHIGLCLLLNGCSAL